jgi:hypothetical protein
VRSQAASVTDLRRGFCGDAHGTGYGRAQRSEQPARAALTAQLDEVVQQRDHEDPAAHREPSGRGERGARWC